MSSQVNIVGLDPAAVLAALYNVAQPKGLGFLQYNPAPMSVEVAKAILSKTTSFDYLRGRALKIDIEGDFLHARVFDEYHSPGLAARVVESLRQTGDVNNELIRREHASGTRESIHLTRSRLREETTLTSREDFTHVKLGLEEWADVLGPKLDEAEDNLVLW